MCQFKKKLLNMSPNDRRHGEMLIKGEEALPYILIRGQHISPLVVITAAIHGCEYVGTGALLELINEWSAVGRCSVLVIPVVNITGFWSRTTTVVPEDNSNLNRIFQSKLTHDTMSKAIVTLFKETILPEADMLIDLHGGSMEEALTPHGYYSALSSEKIQQASKQLLAVSELPIIHASTAKGGLYQLASIDYHIPSVIIEQGQLGTCTEKDILLMKNRLYRILNYISSDDESTIKETYTEFHQCDYVINQAQGCWFCKVVPNQRVIKGQLIGELYDLHGNLIKQFFSRVEGVVLYHKATLASKPDDVLIAIAH